MSPRQTYSNPHDSNGFSWALRLLRLAEVDRAVFFALLLRAWQLVGGTVSAVLIVIFFTPDVQGYYYTIVSLLALQTFFELGFGIVITNVSSHEWAGLRLGKQGMIVGQPTSLSRLVSLGRLIFCWYGVALVGFVAIVGALGMFFLSQQTDMDGDWQSAWTAAVVLSGLLLWTQPFAALLEGCNQVAVVYRYRLKQAVAANVVVWIAIALGTGLWALVAAAVARVACDLYLLLVRYRTFFQPFWRAADGPRILWRSEIWPMQWRLGVGSVFHYFSCNLFTPVMFYYRDAQVAGQMGMTWVLVSALQAAALAWVQTRVPRMGMLVAEKDYNQLDGMFRRLTLISLSVVGLGGLALSTLVYVLHTTDSPLAGRLLGPAPTALLLLATLVYQVPHCQAFYLRAHKREILLWVSIVTGTAVGLLVWILGGQYGPTGAAAGYLAVVTLFTFPYQTYLWLRCRREWH